MALINVNMVYEKCHNITVMYDANMMSHKEVIVKLNKSVSDPVLQLKIVEVDNYSFNYTSNIDRSFFNKMKSEQYLEINYEELESQIIDLLHATQNEQMFLRLEVNSINCKMIFYEKARLKSLIFLTIDFHVTDQQEIISEITKNNMKMKDFNTNLSLQLNTVKSQLHEKESLLNTALTSNKIFERQVMKDMQILETAFCTNITKIERNISDRLTKLNRKHLKIINDLDTVKSENDLKCESSVRLVNSMHNLRIENERHFKVIDDLKLEVNHLTILRNNADKQCGDLRQDCVNKDRLLTDLHKQNAELRKDLQDATIIIAQKTKTHDEIAKDLVQANTMLVNFNNHYDSLNKDLEAAKACVQQKDAIVKEQVLQIKKMADDFEKYQQEYDINEINQLKLELNFTKRNLIEMEKQNKETIKMNGLLTKKISSGETVDINTARNMNWLPPSLRHNY